MASRDIIRDQERDLEDLRDERDEIVQKCKTQGYSEKRRRRLADIDETVARLTASIAQSKASQKHGA